MNAIPTKPGTFFSWTFNGPMERIGYRSNLFGIYRRGDGRWVGVHLPTGRGCGVNMRTLSGAQERLRRILAHTGEEVWDTDFGYMEDKPDEEGQKKLRELALAISHPDTYVGGNR